MKNNVFNMQRFALLCRKEWLENWKGKLLIRVLAPILAFILIMWWNYYMDCKMVMDGTELERWVERANDSMTLVATWFFAAYAIGITSQMMKRAAERKSRISWLLTPASALEKYLVSFLFLLVSVFVVFSLAFVLEELLRVIFFSAIFPDLPVHFIKFSRIVGDGSYGVLANNMNQFSEGLWMAAGIFSIFVLGSSLWPKNSVVYTLITGVLLYAVCYLILDTWIDYLFPEGWWSVSHISHTIAQDYGFISWYTWLKSLLCGSIPFCLILAYYRFRELEIINRW